MFQNIDRFYEQQTVQRFLLLIRSPSAIALSAFAVLAGEDELAVPIESESDITHEDIEEMQRQLKRRVNARCGDLVELMRQEAGALLSPM